MAGLVLGKLGRSGPLVWTLPLEANQAIRHIGLLFFLAAVGVMACGRFLEALAGSGWRLFVLGFFTTTVTTAMTLLLLRHPGKAREMGENGRRAVEESYHWAAESEKLLRLYGQLVQTQSSCVELEA